MDHDPVKGGSHQTPPPPKATGTLTPPPPKETVTLGKSTASETPPPPKETVTLGKSTASETPPPTRQSQGRTQQLRDMILDGMVLTYLYAAKYKKTAVELEMGSRTFLNLETVKMVVVEGEWERLKDYFTSFLPEAEGPKSPSTDKIFSVISIQKFLESLLHWGNDLAAERILQEEIRWSPSGDKYKRLRDVLLNRDNRKNVLNEWKDVETSRQKLVFKLNDLLKFHPDLKEKLMFPTIQDNLLAYVQEALLKLDWVGLEPEMRPGPGLATTFNPRRD